MVHLIPTANHPDQKDWVEMIDMIEFAINLSASTSTGYTPFKLNYGYMPQMLKEFQDGKITAKGITEFTV